ncbi:MAG: YncE family protein [Flavobacteriales bacterium]
MKKTFIYLSILGSFLTSCSNDDNDANIPKGNYSDGIWIVNQGNFGSGNASLSFYDGTIENSVFNTVNSLDLGDTAQSSVIEEDKLYVVVNASNKITVINRHTGKLITEIDTGLNNPRYAVKANSHQLYVSNWGGGSDASDDFIAVINTETNTVEKTIPVTEGPEKLVLLNNKVYVLHRGGWGYGSTVSSIDITTESVTSVKVGDIPGSYDVNGNDLYILCEGNPSYATTETEGKLFKVDTSNNSVSQIIDFNRNGTIKEHPTNFQLSDNELNTGYYEMSGTIYKENLTSNEVSTILENVSMNDMKIKGTDLYYTNPGDYLSAGSFVQYNLATQTEVKRVATAIIPGDITITP